MDRVRPLTIVMVDVDGQLAPLRVFCADQSATFTTLCKLGERGEVNNHCMQIPCPDLLKTQPEAKFGFRLVRISAF